MATKKTHTHWKKTTDRNYLGEWDLPEKGDLVVTIDKYKEDEKVETFKGDKKSTENHFVIWFKEAEKPMILNTTNKKRIAAAVGSPYIEDWPGHKVALYRDKVKAFGDIHDCIRIRSNAPEEKTYICEECGSEIKAEAGHTPKQIAAASKKQLGRELCMECARAAKEEEKQDQEDKEDADK